MDCIDGLSTLHSQTEALVEKKLGCKMPLCTKMRPDISSFVEALCHLG